MNMILLEQGEMARDGSARLSGARARHAHSVLKARPGDILRIGLLNGAKGRGTVRESLADRLVLDCQLEQRVPPRPRIDLILAMPRPKVLARLWPQLSALGVGIIVILKADKVERSYMMSHVLDQDYIDERLRIGLQQACCTHMPRVLLRQRFKAFIEDELDGLFPGGPRLLAEPSASQRLWTRLASADFQAEVGDSGSRALLAIGPEGGWNEYEIDSFRRHAFDPVGFGPRILQSDTACIAALAMLGQALDCSANDLKEQAC
jgi:RsmE family RNA methyltransferase